MLTLSPRKVVSGQSLPRHLPCRGFFICLMGVCPASVLWGLARLEVRPHHEDDGSHAERQQHHQAEVKFCPLPSLLSSVHLSETSGATASARRSISSLRIMALSAELILKYWPSAAATMP